MSDRWLDHFYVSFLGRDFAYFSAGVVSIFAIENAFAVDNLVPKAFETWTAIYFVAAAYFVGLMLSEILRVIPGIVPRVELSQDRPGEHLVRWELIVRHYSPRTLIQHERTVFLMHVGCSLASAFFLTSIVLLLNRFLANHETDVDVPPGFVLDPKPLTAKLFNEVGMVGFFAFIIGLFLILYGRHKARQARQELQALADGLP